MKYLMIVVCLAAVTAPSAAVAQTRAPIAPGNAVLLAAYKCQADELARADTLVQDVAAPVLNKHVAAGRLLNWGYLSVYIGDQANRSIYVWAANPVALMQARAVYLPELNGNPKFADFVRICGSATITVHNLVTTAPAPAK